jgi:hypothetical protein
MVTIEIALTLVGLGLASLGTGFTFWSFRLNELKALIRKVEGSLDKLLAGFHLHQIDVERRLSRLEMRKGQD